MRLIVLFLLFSLTAAVGAQDAPRAVGKDLMVKALPDFAGREGVVRANVYPPGASSPPHRHDAHVFLHLLEGELIVQVKGYDIVLAAFVSEADRLQQAGNKAQRR